MNIQSLQGSHLSDKEQLVINHNNSNVCEYLYISSIVSPKNNNMYLIKKISQMSIINMMNSH
jgi:hypothetical protein